MEFEIRADQCGGKLGVRGCSCSGAPDLRGNVVEFLAVLVRNYGPGGSSRICCDDNTAIVEAADDGCAGAGGFGERDAAGVEGDVAVVV